ncbi:sugar diacid utilization regulator [Croceifilum oryzae]|uniref:Sugar diacid utilization regulator n=1 Tax=Croceifilum oryzae TaxID=1553429 RepID=A0AAJ1TBS5_9BACL|nr:helix-turn-helix domain-containing protein [Croceifilum oryzae]MDQ0415940.1 sugar diacid utilization regulator [Croceifilum oryzae]
MTKSQELTQTCSNLDSVALFWQQGVRNSLSRDFFKKIEKWCLFYIQVDSPIQGEQIEVDWEKLLKSYFADPDLSLVEVAYEQWIVIQPDHESEQSDRTTERNELLSKARGLLERVRSEVGGEARIIVGEKVVSSETLFEEMDRMKRAERMSYKIDPDQAIVTTWNTFLYELIQSLQVHQLDQVCAVIPTTPLWSDGEMMKTIQCFLEEDLNVSETARKLYIHRNTLLYRLEKIREEIGYDLRVFDEAMMVKLMQFILRRKADVAR